MKAEDPGLRYKLSKFDNKMSLQDLPLLQSLIATTVYVRKPDHDSDILNSFAGMSYSLASVADSKISLGMFDSFFD